MSKELENARKALNDDLKNAPYVLSNPLGHCVTCQKIHRYLFECVISNEKKSECVDWLYDLYKKQNEQEQHSFQLTIDSMAIALYDFYEYLKNSEKNGRS